MKKFLITILPFLLFLSNSFAIDGSVIKFSGDVRINNIPAKNGMYVSDGDKAEALGKKSFVQIQFTNGSKILLRDGSLILKKMKSKETELALLKGIIFSYVKKDSKSKFTIKSNNVSMAVRGTKFYVSSSPEDTYLCVCEGVVEIENEKGKAEVKVREDVHATYNSELKITKANDMMWDMAKEGFDLMDVPVN